MKSVFCEGSNTAMEWQGLAAYVPNAEHAELRLLSVLLLLKSSIVGMSVIHLLKRAIEK